MVAFSKVSRNNLLYSQKDEKEDGKENGKENGMGRKLVTKKVDDKKKVGDKKRRLLNGPPSSVLSMRQELYMRQEL